MPLSLQSRLLRVLQEREVLRVGATEPTPVNVRVIAATHRNLLRHVEEGSFRQDLFYRLNILRIDMPPLRDRLDDLPELVRALHAKVCARLDLDPARTEAIAAALIAQAPSYHWPGNVRELENLVERLVAYADPHADPYAKDDDNAAANVSSETARAFVHAVAPELFSAEALSEPAEASSSLKAHQAQRERAEIQRVLDECGGDRALASQRLGISRTTLWRKLNPA
jgi:propionate catabolism operon transcriptional regulator